MASKLSSEEIEEKMKSLKDWDLEDEAITRQFVLGSFMDAIDFVNRLAPLAEAADHHPDITINFRRVTLLLSTHSEGGLTAKDFDLARKIDRIVGN
jgi:4a-hydroxytetrahydrobiopterin dehydratase